MKLTATQLRSIIREEVKRTKSLLEDLLDNAEELRGLAGSNQSPPGRY